MFSPSRLSSHFFLLFLLLVSVSVNGAPAGSQRVVREVVKRQAYTGPQTVQQVTTSQTPQGTVVTTCEVTLTPTKDANGNDQVLEVKQCTVALVGSSAASTDTSSATSTSVSATTTDSTSTTSTDSTSATSTSSSSDSTTTSSASSSSSASAAISTNPVTSVSISSSASSATSTASAASSSSSASAAEDASSSGSASSTSVTTAGAASSGTAAAENSSASATPFAIPGKKLQVLPIGLGVFAGISVIALIVVALVTYERTKYRRAFRKNRLREQAAPMGYGGMAQRDP
ncbi:hypothetical protein SCHPADRAFT_936276 [Schizopora paradoxa]|uniref:Mid2 domain-containing protein n=1 Tax=Schizopora paradoxa TaxID=27342 RepID=A0A0H2S287_9AGAM|nr:hypothetical protein SCHPADRAFT_936276 [Schizopora paradoxa]